VEAGPRQAEAVSPGTRVGWGRLLTYALPVSAFSFYLFFIQFYFLKYATDVLLLPPAISLLFGAGRLWDAVTDPLVGTWSDRTRSRLGRRRSWMFAGVPLLALFFLMVWRPPAWEQGPLILWLALALAGFYTAYTIYQIPHQALGVELSPDHHERTRIFGAHRMSFMAGMMVVFIAMQWVINAEDRAAAAASLATGAAVLLTLALLVPPLFLREREEFQGRGASSGFRALGDVWRNPHARVLLLVWLMEGVGGGALGVLAPYTSEYVAHRPDLTAILPAFFMVPAVLGIPVWVGMSRRWGKKRVWLAAIAGSAFFFGWTIVVQQNITLLCAVLVGAGFCNGAGGAIGVSMLADTIDWDELRTGERKEGAYSAAWGFALKLSIGLVIAFTGVALQVAGFQPNVEQTPMAEWTLRLLFGGLPLVGGVAAFGALSRFGLDEREHGRIRAQLDAR